MARKRLNLPENRTTFSLCATRDKIPAWHEFIKLCDERGVTMNRVMNAVIPTLVRAMRDSPGGVKVLIWESAKIDL